MRGEGGLMKNLEGCFVAKRWRVGGLGWGGRSWEAAREYCARGRAVDGLGRLELRLYLLCSWEKQVAAEYQTSTQSSYLSKIINCQLKVSNSQRLESLKSSGGGTPYPRPQPH